MIVITNRSDKTMSFRLIAEQASVSSSRELAIKQGDCLPIRLVEPAMLSFDSADKRKEYRVTPGNMYYFFLNDSGETDIQQIGLDSPPSAPHEPPIAAARIPTDTASIREPATVVIPVKILFDDSEILTRSAWEVRMRKRFDEVSRIFRKHCFTEFRIVAVDSWHTRASAHSLLEALNEFENVVDPRPAQVAIGFLARRLKRPEDGRLGSTPGPLSNHVLVHERVNENTERECLELLVHELGHFLGAAHSPEANSVMRPKLGDRHARSPRFRIVFDPLNTLAMCLVSQELGADRTIRFDRVSPLTKAELGKIYFNLNRANPKDPAASYYLRVLGGDLPMRTGPRPIDSNRTNGSTFR